VGGGKRPVLSFKAPVKVKLNGKPLDSETPVVSTDLIEWEVEEKPLFEIQVSENKLSVFFHLRSLARYAWRLVQTGAKSRVVLRAEQDKSMVLDSLHVNDVLNAVVQMGIQSKIDIAALQQE